MPTIPRRTWSRDELLLALHLYMRLPFGQQHARNPQIIKLATVIGRTPGSVAMKLNNITSLDPEELARGVVGLSGASARDREVWSAFQADPIGVGAEAEALWVARVEHMNSPATEETLDRAPASPKMPERVEGTSVRRVRLAQSFFRRVVLENFGGKCALTELSHPDLINASHIVGWAEDDAYRVDPRNGIALNRLHDAAFDRKLITFDEDLRLVVGRALRDQVARDAFSSAFLSYEGQPLRARVKHELHPALLARHREAFAKVNA